MEHTYLRYECGDSFGLTAAAPSSKAPAATDSLAWLHHHHRRRDDATTSPLLLTVAGSLVTGWNLKTATLALKVGHTELLSGGVGTGRALNSDEMVCLAASTSSDMIATGWVDGAVRIFTVGRQKVVTTTTTPLSHSLLDDDEEDETFLHAEPLVLQGHGSAVRALAWHESTLLASAANDGAIVLWDVVAESGLYRLRGHRGPVTQLVFGHGTAAADTSGGSGSTPRYLVSTSLDQLVKVWDLEAQVCTQTIATHRGGVLCATVVGTSRMVTGASDGHVRLWNVQSPKATALSQENEADMAVEGTTEMTNADDQFAQFMGRLLPPPNVATSAEKIVAVHALGNRWVGVLHGSRAIHIYRKRGTQEAIKKKQRRLKRKQQKQQQKETNQTDDAKKGRKRGLLDDDVESDEEDGKTNPLAEEEQGLDPEQLKASDEFEYVTTIRPSHKVRDFIFHPRPSKGEVCRVVCSLSTNGLEVHSVTKEKENYSVEKGLVLDGHGHPTGIRAISLSSDDRLACTVSKSSTKIWNVHRRSLIQTLSPSVADSKTACYGLCVAFLPGNTLVVMGTREGHVLLIDIASGNVLSYEQNAHEGAVWNIDVRKTTADETTVSLVTGSADKTVKFWNVVLDEDDRPVLEHTRVLQMTDDVLAVKYSHSTDPTRRMIFVSTLDSTIKVFYEDSLKLFLSLYGHKLPALAVDASDDDVLLVSGAADKTIKIWGLDFGDTHRTLHGHEDSITDIRMVPRTHNFFTSSKDGTVRYWDGDRFEQVLNLPGHFAEVQCLAVSRTGAFVLSGGMDRQVRVWERTKDIVFLQEERERALEQVFDKVDGRNEGGTAEILERKGQEENEQDAEDEGPQSEMAVKRSILSVAAGDRLVEALEKADQELKDMTLFKRNNPGKTKSPNMYLLGLEPSAYVLWVLKSIPTADLEQSLLVLPSTHLERLFYYLIVSLRAGRGVELSSRVAVFMVKAHQNQVSRLVCGRKFSSGDDDDFGPDLLCDGQKIYA